MSKKLEPVALAHPEVTEEFGHTLLDMRAEHAQTQASALALAKELRYEGAVTLGGLEDEIRFYQRKTVEACLELGKRLLLLKEIAPHGTFRDRVGLLGISERTAQRFMQAAFKTAKSAKLADLSSMVKSQSAFLELVTEDDATLERLAEIDDIDRMGPTDLRKAVRELRGEVTAKDERIAVKNKQIDELQDKVIRIKKAKPDETAAMLAEQFGKVVADAKGALSGGLRAAVDVLIEHHRQYGGADMTLLVAGAVASLRAELQALCDEHGIPDIGTSTSTELGWIADATAAAAQAAPGAEG